jgi:hypothetical protein
VVAGPRVEESAVRRRRGQLQEHNRLDRARSQSPIPIPMVTLKCSAPFDAYMGASKTVL